MSPTATIATVIVALVLLAWLFQSDTRDPGYEAWRKRQLEERQDDDARREVAGATVTDPKAGADPRSLEEIRRERDLERLGPAVNVTAPIVVDISDAQGDPFRGVTVSNNGDINAPLNITDWPKDSQNRQNPNREKGFGSNQLLNGTYVGVAYVGDTPRRSARGEEPSIIFRRDGTFTTQNMASAEVDMEAGTALGSAVDRGSGHYKISGIELLLTYNDGLNRKKGNKRTYVIIPLAGTDDAPTAITIQGKLFNLDPQG